MIITSIWQEPVRSPIILDNILMEQYDVADQRENEAFAEWNTDYEVYREMMDADRANYESLDCYMLFLHYNDYLTFVEINNPAIWEEDGYCELFESLGVDLEKITDETDFLVIQDAGKRVEYFEKFRKSENEMISESGTINIFASESGTYGAYLDGEELFTVSAEQGQDLEMRITIVNKNTKEVVDQSCFFKRTDIDRLRTYMKK